VSDKVVEVTNLEQWDALKSEEKVQRIIEAGDWSRIDSFGGYFSEYEIRWGHVIRASVIDGSREPELTIQPIDEFIADNEWYITDDLNEQKEDEQC